MKSKRGERRFSPEQMAYIQAKALFEVCRERHDKYEREMDAEGVRLGIAQPGEMYVSLPEGHPMWAKAQKLFDSENAACELMYEAARNLFDWATESTLARLGTAQQKADIRQMVETVKKMAFVEKPFEELVEMSMRLAA